MVVTRVPGWLGSALFCPLQRLCLCGGRRACSNCVFPARARGFGTRSHAGCLFQTAEPPQPTRAAATYTTTPHVDTPHTPHTPHCTARWAAGPLGVSCRYRIAYTRYLQ
ncbi:hypothetical protein F5Y03DRAFT_350997 [Xylaria venustula]|nr:hypothetical protein F5Y03DRAFT_350997 [Xylaria venustula]